MASSSSSKPSGGWTYDVFLSFRGEDTRNTFVDHLYGNLVQKGIITFKDDVMIRSGNQISQELRHAIKESRFMVVVFSKNYANSSWCLGELAEIMKCGRKVFPVFYHVDPSHVRHQKRDYATAFEKHEENFNGDKNEVSKWRDAFARAASISGYHISADCGGEFSVINKIVQDILDNMQPHGTEDNLIGIESHIDALNSLLSMQTTKEVRFIGIFGMGGIGKTTIARALFRRINSKYDGSSFVNNVREHGSSKKDICALQEKILKDVLGTSFNVDDPDNGAGIIQERFCNKKVLLILDDVTDVSLLDFLAATKDWFGPGSRVVITTRDEHLLSEANFKYKPPLLSMDQAVELFSRHAFQKNRPPDGYKVLSNHAIRYTGRLPLALKVLGSFFRGREAGVWKSALDRLAKIPDSKVFKTLKLNFDNLNELEQKIFLDIACFFKGEKVDDVTKILEGCDFHPVIGICVLIEKSLITVSKGEIGMHDLIQEMGLQIVRESYTNSRLRKLEEVQELTVKKKVLEGVEAIAMHRLFWLSFLLETKLKGFRANIFERMNNLRLLDVSGSFTSQKPSFLPDSLRWIRWKLYPFASLPIAHMNKLVGLEIAYSEIKHLWKGQKIMRNLKFIHLNSLDRLTRFPDVSEAPNIERLTLEWCSKLVEVHESLGFLKRLVYLRISDCEKLKHLPSRFEMESLETLILRHCPSLERIPETDFTPLCSLKKLELRINIIGEEDFPINLDDFTSLEELNLSWNSELVQLPATISHLSQLKTLKLDYCHPIQRLQSLPSGIQVLTAIHCTSLEKIADLSKEYECLSKIWLNGCQKLLEDEQSQSYLDKMLKESFLKKWAALDRCLSICIPGSQIPSWFKQQQHGYQISLQLPPKWQTKILGFALCGVCKAFERFEMVFTFDNNGTFAAELEADKINASAAPAAADEGRRVWFNYIPFTSFELVPDDFQREDWSHITQVDVAIQYQGLFKGGALRCGAHVVYKEDVESIQHIKPSHSSYWNWKLQWTASNNCPVPATLLFFTNL